MGSYLLAALLLIACASSQPTVTSAQPVKEPLPPAFASEIQAELTALGSVKSAADEVICHQTGFLCPPSPPPPLSPPPGPGGSTPAREPAPQLQSAS